MASDRSPSSTELAATIARIEKQHPGATPGATISPRELEVAATIRPNAPDARVNDSGVQLPRIVVAGAGDSVGDAAEYEICGSLGAGGMGRVDLATQKVFRRTVALKRIKADRMCVPAVEALVHEAEVTGALDHPNIVPAITFGQTTEGEPLLVMKHVQGVPWSVLIHDANHAAWAPYAHDRLGRHLEIVGKVCHALESAHRQGIVHRDLKPENVMIGDLGEVYVLDWGIALRASDPRSNDLAGTPAYMAPEMLAGSASISARTDVYLLGATLHEVLTGQPPHAGDSIGEVLLSIDAVVPFEYGPEVPRELAAVCARAMSRDPAARHETALAFREAIDAFIRHRGSAALAEHAAQRVAKIVRLATSVDEAAVGSIRRLATEADLGFREALSVWPENEMVIAQRRELVERMAAFEIDARNAPGAAAWLAELSKPNGDLQVRLAALKAEIAEQAVAKDALARVGFEQNVDVGRSHRLAALATLNIVLGVAFVIAGAKGVRIGAREVTITFALGVTLIVAVMLARRRTFVANAANWRLVVSMYGMAAAFLFTSGRAWATGQGIDATIQQIFALSSLAFFLIATWTAPFMYVYVLVGIAPIAIAALWPGHAAYALASTSFAMLALMPVVAALRRKSRG